MARQCFLLLWFFVSVPASAEDIEIGFDLTSPTATATGQASGLFHSLTGTEPPDRFVAPMISTENNVQI